MYACNDLMCGIRNSEKELRPRNHMVSSSILGCMSPLWDFAIAHTFGMSRDVSPRMPESRKIGFSRKNLFLNRCEINMFTLNLMLLKYSDFFPKLCLCRLSSESKGLTSDCHRSQTLCKGLHSPTIFKNILCLSLQDNENLGVTQLPNGFFCYSQKLLNVEKKARNVLKNGW